MPILTPVIKLVVFRQSLRPHSAIAFLVEFLCFVLELLDQKKDLAKIFGIICACDTLIFTLIDLIQNMIEEKVNIRRYGRVFWLYTNDGRLYWHTLNAYLLILCIVHVIGSVVSYGFSGHYLVLIPLLAAGLELVPQDAYRALGNDKSPATYSGPELELRDSVGPIVGPIDCSDIEQGDVVGIEVELEQEVGDHVGPDDGP